MKGLDGEETENFFQSEDDSSIDGVEEWVEEWVVE